MFLGMTTTTTGSARERVFIWNFSFSQTFLFVLFKLRCDISQELGSLDFGKAKAAREKYKKCTFIQWGVIRLSNLKIPTCLEGEKKGGRLACPESVRRNQRATVCLTSSPIYYALVLLLLREVGGNDDLLLHCIVSTPIYRVAR